MYYIYLSNIFISVAPTVTIEFETGNVTASEGDGSVTVNLVRTGNHSESITVYISIMRVENSAIAERMYIMLCMHNIACICNVYSVSH